jgi:hypothetical protein
MTYSKLKEPEIYRALSENHRAIASLRRYQGALARREALPSGKLASSELMSSNSALIETIENENAALITELKKRDNQVRRRT